MELTPIHIDTLRPPKDDLLSKIRASTLTLEEYDIVAISSKVLSIHEGRCVPMTDIEHDALIRQEADQYLERAETPGGHVMHTITQDTLIPNAGIDPFGGHYVLWPLDPMKSAKELEEWFKQEYGLKNVYVVVTDSRSVLMRRGVVGIAIGWAGFSPVYDNRLRRDLLGERSGGSQTNIPDALAAAAVFVMGEANEGTPIVRIRNAPYVQEAGHVRKEENSSYRFPIEEDIFAPFLTRVPWKRKDEQVG